ncbi:MAG: D-alanyl-D-alanine carboxypeptidase family protein [Clostridia bacterium]|nr:D-alanyl-D-alanine carboxypeptidase family protein [Clostridia bacterium]
MMPQNHTYKKRNNRSPYLFILLVLALLTAALVFGARAMNTWKVYEAEAAVTPAPTPTVKAISVTPDPFRVTPAPTPEPTPAPSPTPGLLNSGSQGEAVKELQKRLQELGYYTGQIDGDYGTGTKAAVQTFQKINSLDADGIAGQKTQAVLYSDSAKAAPGPTDVLADNRIPLLVNAKNPLPDGFSPANLVQVKDIAGSLMTYEKSDMQGVREAVEALARMIQDAVGDGYTPWKLRESYRTIADQTRIFNNRVSSYMNENELTRSQAIARTRQSVADPGCSEHHTGLAFDLNVPGESFGDTAQYLWLKQHCWDYGFIMRYTDEKSEITGITGEEWHVRYVGTEHSLKMRDMDMCLEEYVEWLKKQ